MLIPVWGLRKIESIWWKRKDFWNKEDLLEIIFFSCTQPGKLILNRMISWTYDRCTIFFEWEYAKWWIWAGPKEGPKRYQNGARNCSKKNPEISPKLSLSWGRKTPKPFVPLVSLKTGTWRGPKWDQGMNQIWYQKWAKIEWNRPRIYRNRGLLEILLARDIICFWPALG